MTIFDGMKSSPLALTGKKLWSMQGLMRGSTMVKFVTEDDDVYAMFNTFGFTNEDAYVGLVIGDVDDVIGRTIRFVEWSVKSSGELDVTLETDGGWLARIVWSVAAGLEPTEVIEFSQLTGKTSTGIER